MLRKKKKEEKKLLARRLMLLSAFILAASVTCRPVKAAEVGGEAPAGNTENGSANTENNTGTEAGSTTTENSQEGWEGSLYFVIQDGQAILTNCRENASTVTIPAAFHGYPVTEIGTEAFAFCESLTKITIPKNIQKIGSGAFSHATKLAKVSFEGELESIGQEAFAYCYSLKKIELPKGITELPAKIFYQCLSLERVTVPDGVTTVQSAVFANCPNLKAALMPKTIENVSSYDCFNSGAAYTLYAETEKDPLYQAQDRLGQTDPYYSWLYGSSSLYDNADSLRVHFLPVAKAPTLDKTKKGVLALTWKSRGNSVAGFEIEYSKNKSFTKGVKTVKHALKNPDPSGTDTIKKTLKGVKSKETWYVRIRAYETCSGTKVYGAYSKVKKVVVP